MSYFFSPEFSLLLPKGLNTINDAPMNNKDGDDCENGIYFINVCPINDKLGETNTSIVVH